MTDAEVSAASTQVDGRHESQQPRNLDDLHVYLWSLRVAVNHRVRSAMLLPDFSIPSIVIRAHPADSLGLQAILQEVGEHNYVQTIYDETCRSGSILTKPDACLRVVSVDDPYQTS